VLATIKVTPFFVTRSTYLRMSDAVDTAMLLTDFIEKSRAKGRKTSVVFLDVKGAFDHVAKGRLL
jgi:hypothetical protein